MGIFDRFKKGKKQEPSVDIIDVEDGILSNVQFDFFGKEMVTGRFVFIDNENGVSFSPTTFEDLEFCLSKVSPKVLERMSFLYIQEAINAIAEQNNYFVEPYLSEKEQKEARELNGYRVANLVLRTVNAKNTVIDTVERKKPDIIVEHKFTMPDFTYEEQDALMRAVSEMEKFSFDFFGYPEGMKQPMFVDKKSGAGFFATDQASFIACARKLTDDCIDSLSMEFLEAEFMHHARRFKFKDGIAEAVLQMIKDRKESINGKADLGEDE